MAGTLRISVDDIQGFHRSSHLREFAKHALRGLRSRHDGDEAEGGFCMEIVGGTKETQRTKPFDMPEDGHLVRLNKVFFVHAPQAGHEPSVLRLLRLQRSGGEVNEGEAVIPNAVGTFPVQLISRGRIGATVTLTVKQGLCAPPSAASAKEPAASSSSAGAFQPASPNHAALPAFAALPPPLTTYKSGTWLQTPKSAAANFSPTGPTPEPLSPASCRSMVGHTPPIPCEPPAAKPTVSPIPDAIKTFMRRPDIQSAGPTLLQARASPVTPAFASSPGASSYQSGTSQALSASMKPQRTRPPGLPTIGTCSVTVEAVSDLPESIKSPLLIVGLEGHEFRAPDPCKNGPMEFIFSMASAQNGLQLHLYDGVKVSSATGQPSPLARILLPLSDVMWPTGDPVSYRILQRSLDQGTASFRREYSLRFLPELEKDCWNSELALADCFDHRWSGCPEPERWGAFGRARITVQITLKKEVRSLIGLYFASMVVGFQGTQLAQPRCLRGDTERPPPPTLEALQDPSAQGVLRNADLRNVFSYLARLSHSTEQQALGVLAWLREETWHGVAAAVAWFFFCALGFFPCRLWQAPIYIWLFLLGNGFLASRQRKRIWSDSESQANLFWREDFSSYADARGKAAVKIACRAREVEPMVRITALFVEKVRNTLTFADGPASIVCFVALGMLAATISLVLLVFSFIDPGCSYLCGVYGAVAIVALSRTASQPLAASSPPSKWEDPQHEPAKMQWLLHKVLGTVPDQAEMAHRFVAAKVQGLEVMEV